MKQVSRKSKLIAYGTLTVLGLVAITGSLRSARRNMLSSTDVFLTSNTTTASLIESTDPIETTAEILSSLEVTALPVTDALVTTPVTEAPVTSPVTEAPVTTPVTDAPVTTPVTENGDVATSEYRYVLNTNSKKFHYPTCSSVKRMKKANTAYSDKSRDALIDMGYSPCGNCKP